MNDIAQSDTHIFNFSFDDLKDKSFILYLINDHVNYDCINNIVRSSFKKEFPLGNVLFRVKYSFDVQDDILFVNFRARPTDKKPYADFEAYYKYNISITDKISLTLTEYDMPEEDTPDKGPDTEIEQNSPPYIRKPKAKK